jgi:CRISPR-associated endonuclease/helicase Cas3
VLDRLPEHFLLWAKTVPGDASRYHPLGYHSLDVGAVAELLVGRDQRRFAAIAECLGAEVSALGRFTTWLVAMHDIGKAARVFQRKADLELAHKSRVRRAALLDDAKPDVPGPPHGQLTAWHLTHGGVQDLFERSTPDWHHSFRSYVVDAVAGHHGRPVAREGGLDETHVVGRGVGLVAGALAEEMAKVIGVKPVAIGEFPTNDPAVTFAWYVATLLPVADWIASNIRWFESTMPGPDLADYWATIARPGARKALAESGIGRGVLSRPDAALILPHGRAASPVQAWANTVALPDDGPMLAIVEDATGSGKTEAALILSHRLMHASLGSGFYLALPTMATANAMFDRLGAIYGRMFEPGSDPSLILAHGKAQRNPDFLASIQRAPLGGNGGEEPVGRYCNGWIADDRRKAFFAQTGAGTIDQAVLAVLPSKYQTLRLRGLADKVLILDEVHAYDAYLSAEVEGLLTFHAAQGGSAIILSATLPLKTRSRLLAAFAKGAGWRPRPAAVGTAYPLATTLAPAGITETPLASRPDNDREVRVERIAMVAEAEMLAHGLAARGAAVAVIRSTVDAAIDSFERLRAAAPDGVEVDLFHARFLPSDRDAIERRAMRRFGKDASHSDRRGQLLVATQVIEQSLDIDFDVIITDLAPIDLLIQRAGRLWRHRARDAARPVPEAVLRVIAPKPSGTYSDSWLDDVLVEARWVYRDPSLLWQSAKAAFEAGKIVVGPLADKGDNPAHVRRLVEAVYVANRADVLPTEAHRAALRAEGDAYAAQGLADQILLRPDRAYGLGDHAWSDDSIVETRLDDGSRAVRLAVDEGGKLVPLGRDLYGNPDWVASELRLRPKFSSKLKPPTDDQKLRVAPPWAEADRGVRLLVMTREADGARSTDEPALRYTARLGLAAIRDEPSAAQ